MKIIVEYSNIKICIDFCRIHLQECIDNHFIGTDIIKKFGKYTHLVHLWNAKINLNGHYPALKSLKVEEGWADIETYFKILNNVNDNYKVLFEHKSDLITDEELEECYRWIGSLVNR